MKKVFVTLGFISFLLIAAMTVQSVSAGQVYDDPPKKEVKSDKDCTKTCPQSKKCCASKSGDMGNKEQTDKIEDTKTTSTTTTTTTTDTKKGDPDKK